MSLIPIASSSSQYTAPQSSLPLVYVLEPAVPEAPSSLPPAVRIFFQVFDFICTAQRCFFYQERRIRNPTLFLAGILLEYKIGNENRFLSAASKVIQLARVLHSCLHVQLQIARHVKNIARLLKEDISGVSVGYLSAYNATHSWKEIHRRAPPSLHIAMPQLALIARRVELLWEESLQLIKALVRGISRALEIKDVLFNLDKNELCDIFLEIHTLYRMYSVDNSDSLLHQLQELAPEIDAILSFLSIQGSSSTLLQNLQTVFQRINFFERGITRVIKRGEEISTQVVHITTSILSMPSTPLTPSSRIAARRARTIEETRAHSSSKYC